MFIRGFGVLVKEFTATTYVVAAIGVETGVGPVIPDLVAPFVAPFSIATT